MSSKQEVKKAIGKQLADKNFNSLVNSAMHEMDVMTRNLAKGGMNEADARLKVQQLYFKNLQTFSDPVTGSIALMAELKTRIDLDRLTNPDADLVSDKTLKLFEEMRKTTKLVLDAKGKVVRHDVGKLDDAYMQNTKFIDVDDES